MIQVEMTETIQSGRDAGADTVFGWSMVKVLPMPADAKL